MGETISVLSTRFFFDFGTGAEDTCQPCTNISSSNAYERRGVGLIRAGLLPCSFSVI
jgi:hypothetical protein